MKDLNIQRWKPEAFLIGGEAEFNMLPTSKGDFILHDVAQVEFDRLTAQVEELTWELKVAAGYIDEYGRKLLGCEPVGVARIEKLLTRIGEDNE